jgi:tyrosyl-tRNA synthetase
VMLEGTDGRKMSTSWGNVINIVDKPNDMFGKVMSLCDDLIIKYFEVCTDLEKEDIVKIKEELESNSLNPKEAKERLAMEIVSMYHTKTIAEKAKNDWNRTFSEGGVPQDIKEIEVEKETELSDVLLKEKLIPSKSEWRRLVDGGSITFVEKEEKITDPKYVINTGGVYKIGKRRWIKIKIK